MSDLNAEDRDLLERGRNAHDPTEADRRRVKAALSAAIGASSGLVASGTAASVSAIGAKGTAVLILLSAGAIGGAVAYRHATRERAAIGRAEHAAAVRPTARPEAPAAPEEAPPGAEGPPSPPAMAARTATAPRKIARAAAAVDVATAGGATTPAPLSPTTIEAETRLVRAGIAALRAGDPAGALQLFDEHARRYPDGVLAQERTVERVQALRDLGRAGDARAAAAAFLRDHPDSPLATRVRDQANP